MEVIISKEVINLYYVGYLSVILLVCKKKMYNMYMYLY